MHMSSNEALPKKTWHKVIHRTWDSLTAPHQKQEINAKSEHITKVVLLVICIVITPFFINSIIGWLNQITPFGKVMVLALMYAPFVAGWIITDKGYQKVGAFIPCLFFYGVAIYENVIGMVDTPVMLLYAMANILAAILLGLRAQIFFMIISFLGFGGMTIAYQNGWLMISQDAPNMFLSRTGIAFAILTSIVLGVWYLKRQYQLLVDDLRIASANTRSLLETIIDGVVFSNLNGIIEDLNEAAIKLFKLPNKQSAIGKNILTFLSPEDQCSANALKDSMLSGATTGSINCTGLLANGEKISLDINSALFFDRMGNPTGFVSTLRDTTQRKIVEVELTKYREQLENLVEERTAKLKEAVDELESFSYTVSHDLRSPLRGIDGYLSLVYEDNENIISETSKTYMVKVKNSAIRMEKLITDLLDFSRLIRHPVSRKIVNPKEIVESVRDELLNGEYISQPISVTIENMALCQADPLLFRQVFFNLVDNALKYSHTKDRTIVNVGSRMNEKGEVVYFVSDNGIGFNMKYSEKLFGVFQKLHNEPDFEGTGIGLAITYRIVRRHNGKIWAESELGKGSTFFFTL